MAKFKYYSPRLQRSLISPLYHAAKSNGIPMTALASRLIAEGLVRLNPMPPSDCAVAGTPARLDPSDRQQ